MVIGDSVNVKISHDKYEFGLEDCKCNLHGRLTLPLMKLHKLGSLDCMQEF